MKKNRSASIAALVVLLSGSIILPGQAQAQGSLLDALTTPQHYRAGRASSANDELDSNGDSRSIGIGETLTIADIEGPGMIAHIWFTVASLDPFYGRSLVIRMYWDGAEFPSVEAPLGDFFGVGHGAYVDYTSMPVAVSSNGRARTCYWKMPFLKHARITVTNESTEYACDSLYFYVDYQRHETLPPDTPYFHARYRQEYPAKPGDYTILETEGRGHYVGTVYSAQQVELGWYGEGDDRFYIDGEETPSLRGTGTEDYFCDAWGFRQFATPFHGVSLWEGYDLGDRNTAYRWHIADPVPFTKSLKVAIEHRGSIFTDEGVHLGQFNERPDLVSSVAFWYQSPAVASGSALPKAKERVAPYRVLPAAELEMIAEPAAAVSKEGPVVNFMPGTGDAFIEFAFELDKPGRYQINAMIWKSVFSSVYQASLDGQPLGDPMNLYYSGHDPFWTPLDLHDLEAGRHTLRFEGRGAAPNRRTMSVPAHSFGMAYLILLRLEDMPGYRVKMNENLEAAKPKSAQ